MTETARLHAAPDHGEPPLLPPRRHLLGISDLDRDGVERLLGHRRHDRAVARPRGQEAARAPRPPRRQPLLRVLHAHAVELRPRRQAALGRHDGAALLGLLRRQGRVPEGHGADAGGVRPGRDRDPAPAHRRAAARRRRDPCSRRQRRRRKAPAPDPGAARPLHDARGPRAPRRPPRRDRRRRPALAGGPLAGRGARARGRPHDARRPADADAARDRGAGLRGHLGDRRDRRRGRRLRAADAAGAHACGCRLRALAARVRDGVGGHARPGCGPARS